MSLITLQEELDLRSELFNAKQEAKFAIVFAVAVEREACAKVVWEFARRIRQYKGSDPIEDQIAAVIRARGEK